MFSDICLPHCKPTAKILLCLIFCCSLLALACHKNPVTQEAQANPNQPPNTTASPATNPAAVPNPQAATPNGSVLPAPGERQVAVGIAPDYKAGQPTPSPAAAASAAPNVSPTIRHIENGKMIIVQGKHADPAMDGPPPTPTPTPAPTPVVEMVNGKIKQQWQAPAEFANMKNPLKVNAEVVKKGKYLYKNRCEICHGAEGRGNGSYNDPKWTQSTNLASKAVQANNDGELFYKVSTSRDRHPASKVLYSEEERWMVVSFLRTLK